MGAGAAGRLTALLGTKGRSEATFPMCRKGSSFLGTSEFISHSMSLMGKPV